MGCASVGRWSPVPWEKARSVAERYGTKWPTPEALLADVDAVSVATPTPLHFSMSRQSLSLGKHVLVRKSDHRTGWIKPEVLTAMARRLGQAADGGSHRAL